MLKWINFLHLYQPPTQSKAMLDRVARESYTKIPDLLFRYPKLKLTINLSGSLLELLEKHGYESLLEKYRILAREGRLELVGSAMYHPILPLISDREIAWQIRLHTDISRRLFGEAFHPKGFYMPEMAFSENTASIVRKEGFEWVILDEIHFPAGSPKENIRYEIEGNGLKVLFRNRKISKSFPPEYVIEKMSELRGQTLVTAHDGELYGHWHTDDRGFYDRAFTDKNIVFETASEYLARLPLTEYVVPRAASWESTEEELAAGEPFVLWKAKNNAIQNALWDFAESILKILDENAKDESFALARGLADRGLASCAWWWATGAKLSAFSPICWNPTEIEKGARELLAAVRSLNDLALSERLAVEKRFAKLSFLIWEKHWKTR